MFVKRVHVEPCPSALNVSDANRHLLLSAGACSTTPAARPQLSIDISCPHGAQQQTSRQPLPLSANGTDRRTDGRTLDHYTDHAHAYCVGNVTIKDV